MPRVGARPPTKYLLPPVRLRGWPLRIRCPSVSREGPTMKYAHCAAAAVILAGCAAVGVGEDKKVTSPLDFKVKAIDGKELDLAKYKGKVVLIVNVASK